MTVVRGEVVDPSAEPCHTWLHLTCVMPTPQGSHENRQWVWVRSGFQKEAAWLRGYQKQKNFHDSGTNPTGNNAKTGAVFD